MLIIQKHLHTNNAFKNVLAALKQVLKTLQVLQMHNCHPGHQRFPQHVESCQNILSMLLYVTPKQIKSTNSKDQSTTTKDHYDCQGSGDF